MPREYSRMSPEGEPFFLLGVVHPHTALDDDKHVFFECFTGYRRRVLELDEKLRIPSKDFP
jgi:hypothetical protein